MSDGIAPFFSTAEAIRFGWRKTTENLKPLLIVSATGAFLALLQQALSKSSAPGPFLGLAVHGPFLGLAVQVLQAALTLAFIRVALSVVDGRPLDLSRPGDLVAGFWNYFLTSILTGLIVVAGFILLIVPGVIWMLKYGFAAFLAADAGLHPMDALRESGRLTQGVKGHLLGFGLALVGINLLGALALGVGLLFTVPVTFIAAASVLRRLQAREAIEPRRSGSFTLQPTGA